MYQINNSHNKSIYQNCADENIIVIDNFLVSEDAQKLLTLSLLDKFETRSNAHKPISWGCRFSYGSKEGCLKKNTKSNRDYLIRSLNNLDKQGLIPEDSIKYVYEFLTPCCYDNGLQEKRTASRNKYLFCKQDIGSIIKNDGDCVLCNFHEFLISKPLIALINVALGVKITIPPNVTMALTKFGSGAFISDHSDYGTNPIYEVSFIYYLNLIWDSRWGGNLVFDQVNNGRLEISPTGNRLVLFLPSKNSIHQVTPTTVSNEYRYAISGWYWK